MNLPDGRWTIDIPGQPPTVNHMYTRVRGQWSKMAKTPAVRTYQEAVVILARHSRPTGWKSEGQLPISYAFYLKRDADCDNLIKALNDALAIALDINDKMFLPCTTHKSTGHHLPHTIVTVG